jgi:Na+/melibiose symporter-like transporter
VWVAFASAVAAVLFAFMEVRHADTGDTRPASTLADICEGFSYLSDHRLALQLILVLFTALMCTGLWPPLAPFFIRDRLEAPDEVLGWQLSAFGLGATVGGLAAPAFVARLGKGVALRLGLLGEGLCLTAYALTSHVGLSVVITLTWGVLVSVIVVPFYTILQSLVAERYQGRVFAALRLCENGATVMTTLLAAPLAIPFGTRPILLGAGFIYFGAVTAWTRTPAGRALAATR